MAETIGRVVLALVMVAALSGTVALSTPAFAAPGGDETPTDDPDLTASCGLEFVGEVAEPFGCTCIELGERRLYRLGDLPMPGSRLGLFRAATIGSVEVCREQVKGVEFPWRAGYRVC